MLDSFKDLEIMGSNTLPTPLRIKLNAMVDALNSGNIAQAKAMSGDMVFKCTPATVDSAIAGQNRGAGTAQVETLTPIVANTTIVTAGDSKITISGTDMETVEITFALAESDTQANVVTKAKTALNVASVTDLFTVGGTSSTITLTTKTIGANDSALKVKIEPVTCGDELGTVISVNTTTGVAPYTRDVVITLEDASGNIHTWFNADIAVTVTESTAGDGAIETVDLTPTMVNGTVTVPITFSGTFAENDTNTLAVSEQTILGTTVTTKSSVETSIA